MADARSGSGRANGIYEPNMTPLIDVSLVLVVILLVATPLAFQSGIAVNPASSSARKAPEKVNEERVEISVHADGIVEVNRTLVPRAGLRAALGPLISQSPTRLVVVRGEDAVPHGEMVSVLDDVKSLGATHLALVGD